MCAVSEHRSTAPSQASSGSLPDTLRRVDVQPHAALATSRTDRRDVLHHAGLVVHVHDRNEHRIRAGSPRATASGATRPSGVRVDVAHGDAGRLERARRVEHGLVLDPRSDEMRAPRRARGESSPGGEIIRLGRARREEDTFGAAPDARGDLRTRGLDERARASAGRVLRGRIRKLAIQAVAHDGGTAGSSGEVAA